MIKKELSIVISFNRTTDAMSFEEYCLKNNVSGRLIPLPKEISAGCGLAWKCKKEKKQEVEKALKTLNIECGKMTELVI